MFKILQYVALIVVAFSSSLFAQEDKETPSPRQRLIIVQNGEAFFAHNVENVYYRNPVLPVFYGEAASLIVDVSMPGTICYLVEDGMAQGENFFDFEKFGLVHTWVEENKVLDPGTRKSLGVIGRFKSYRVISSRRLDFRHGYLNYTSPRINYQNAKSSSFLNPSFQSKQSQPRIRWQSGLLMPSERNRQIMEDRRRKIILLSLYHNAIVLQTQNEIMNSYIRSLPNMSEAMESANIEGAK